MKKEDHYFKATFINRTDEECMYNTFPAYVIAVMLMLMFAILQGEINLLSAGLYISSLTTACIAAYKLGANKQ